MVVVGGSLGARSVNNATYEAMDAITATGANLLWQTGKIYYDEFDGKTQGKAKVKTMAFLPDMATVYRAATFVISRAGASTISELQLLGVPSILIPSANVSEDHQRKNAMALVERDAAMMILDAEASDRLKVEAPALLNDAARRKRYATNVRSMALAEADERIADEVIKLLTQEK